MSKRSGGTQSARLRSDAVSRYALRSNAQTYTPLLCSGGYKVSFPSRKAAEAHRDEGIKAGRVNTKQEAYKCDECPNFHLTSRPTYKPQPRHEQAYRYLVRVARAAREGLYRTHTPSRAAERMADELIEADLMLRREREGAEGVDAFRAALRLSLGAETSLTAHRGPALRAAEALIPLAIERESWGWMVDARNGLIEQIERCTRHNETSGLDAALQRHLAVISHHVEENGLDSAAVHLAEFEAVSGATADSVEYSVFEQACAQSVEALCEIEAQALATAHREIVS